MESLDGKSDGLLLESDGLLLGLPDVVGIFDGKAKGLNEALEHGKDDGFDEGVMLGVALGILKVLGASNG